MYKILIVEDDRVIADKMKEHLEKWDYEVACVQDFKRVLRKCRSRYLCD